MRFDIEPYVGALPITFGMPREDVYRLLGKPSSSDPIWDGSGTSDIYGGLNVGYDNAGAVKHLGFASRGIELAINGETIWTCRDQPDPNPTLLKLDPHPLESLGFWIYLRLGTTSSGYHDGDLEQSGITVFPRGDWDEFLVKSHSADTSKYRPNGA